MHVIHLHCICKNPSPGMLSSRKYKLVHGYWLYMLGRLSQASASLCTAGTKRPANPADTPLHDMLMLEKLQAQQRTCCWKVERALSHLWGIYFIQRAFAYKEAAAPLQSIRRAPAMP